MAVITNLDSAHAASPHPGSHRVSIASFTRAGNTTAYGAGDVLTDGNTAAIEFPKCGRSGKIIRASLGYEDNNSTATDYELYVFDEEPTNIADNAAFALVSADMPKLVAVFKFNDADAIIVTTTGVDILHYPMDSTTTHPAGHAFVTDDTPTISGDPATTQYGGSLFGLLVTRTGYTPVASTKIHIRLDIQAD